MKTFDYELQEKARTLLSEERMQDMVTYFDNEIAKVESQISEMRDTQDLHYAYYQLFKLNLTKAYFVDDEYRNYILNNVLPEISEHHQLYENIEFNVASTDPVDICNNDECDETDEKDVFDGHTPYFGVDITDTNLNEYVTSSTEDYNDFECDYTDNIRAIHDQDRYINTFCTNSNMNYKVEYNLNKPINELYTKDFSNAKDFAEKKPLPELTLNIEADKKGLEKYEMVNSPKHYNTYSVEVIDMFERIYGPARTADWCEMTALKYRMRMGTKPDNSINQDLDKEQWYLKKAKELRAKVEE